ncbi:MAG TPA: endolytic transglycosylase MltG [Rhodanobacteraceae bacterium]|nr:endolytic transglycosylase MltG [Rhodanobacteraceae bacterium]
MATPPRGAAGGAILRILLGLVVFAVLAAAGSAWYDYSRFTRAPLAIRDRGSLVIPHGTAFKQIVAELRARKLSAAPPLYWRALAWRMGVTDRLHAGEYALVPGTTPPQLLTMMASGEVVQHHVTIVEGRTFHQALAMLRAEPLLRHASGTLDDTAVMKKIDPAVGNPEGWLLPETYDFVRGDSDLDMLRRAYKAMREVLKAEWAQREENLPLDTPYQALILASIVEKETAQPDERPRIAGVFERRLRRGMLLQTDPTVIYGMGSAYHGNIRRKDLTTDTPYNTYTRPGLPPTPIALPGRAAIHAVLHPAEGDALYFVARGDGTHQFSATLREQNAAVARYQLGGGR